MPPKSRTPGGTKKVEEDIPPVPDTITYVFEAVWRDPVPVEPVDEEPALEEGDEPKEQQYQVATFEASFPPQTVVKQILAVLVDEHEAPADLTLAYEDPETRDVKELDEELTLEEQGVQGNARIRSLWEPPPPEPEISMNTRKREVVLKRNIPEEFMQKERRNYTLARVIKPGETIDLYGTEGQVELPPAHEHWDDPVPQALALADDVGPKYNADGTLVEHSVLGDPDMYQTMRQQEEREISPEEAAEQELRSTIRSTLRGHAETEPLPGDEDTTTELILERYKARLAEQEQHKEQLASMRKDKDQGSEENKERLRRMKVFERILAKKEENALRRWRQMTREWSRFERLFTKKFGKNLDDLVMNRAQMHREKMEEYDLLQRAVPQSEKDSENMWEMSLRGGVQRYIQTGPAFFGLFCPMKQDSKRPMEIIRQPRTDGDITQQSIHKSSWKESKTLQAKQKKLAKGVQKVLPYRPEVDELIVAGEKAMSFEDLERNATMPITIDSIKEEVLMEQTAALTEQRQNMEDSMLSDKKAEETPRVNRIQGPSASLTRSHLSFEAFIGETDDTTVTVNNKGTTAVYYQWTKVEKENVLGRKLDTVQRFYCNSYKGSVLPGESETFSWLFKSDKAGVFSEQWELRTVPRTSSVKHLVTLSGVGIREDKNKFERLKLEEHIERNLRLHNVQDIVYDIVDGVHTPRPKSPPPAVPEDETEREFNVKNQGLNLYYSTEVYNDFVRLAEDTYEVLGRQGDIWDSSVPDLEESIVSVDDADTQEELMIRFRELIHRASMPAYRGSALLYSIGYELLVELTEEIPTMSATLRRQLSMVERPFRYPPDDPKEDEEEVPPAKKGGKDAKKKDDKKKDDKKKGKGAVEEEEEPPLDSPDTWDEERKAQEMSYRDVLYPKVWELVERTVDRFDLLCAEGEARSIFIAAEITGKPGGDDEQPTLHMEREGEEEEVTN